MKKVRYLTMILTLLYTFFMCEGHDEADHDQGETAEKSAQTTPAEDDHDHEADEQETAQTEDDKGLIGTGSDWENLIDLQTASTEFRSIELIISIPGNIIPNPNQTAVISPFIESGVNCVFVNVGDRVKTGDMLVCLTSPEIGILRAEYDKAKAELEIKTQNFERQKRLSAENIISKRSFQESELEKRLAEVNFNYAYKKLLATGLKENDVEKPPTGHSDAVGSTIHVYSPISGTVTFRDAKIGRKVDISSKLFEIINLENVWLEADIFEKDLTKIKLDQEVKIKVSAYPDEIFTGKIFYIGSTLHPDTKTIKLLAEIDNDHFKLKPGMYANTGVVIDKKTKTLVVPAEAVLDDENLKIVFVKEGEEYHRHVVQTGIKSDEYIEILSGIEPGSIVVTKGNYQLKSKLKMSGVDPHAGHNH
ncbi:efflux RND transporter periplasmic adaptor subunit [candidate division KSB1 bacterium]